MKFIICALFILISTAFSASATTVKTKLFSIDVPDEWKIEDNRTSIFLAFGNNVVDRTPLPFLSVQYCQNDVPQKDSSQPRCNLPCDDEANNLMSGFPQKEMRFSPVKKSEKENGVTEYSSELTSPAVVSTFITLACNSKGQVHVALSSDLPRLVAKQLFAKILASLKWI
ncbi:MAG: hypothetical protein V4495_16205 [Pseudomonadota bacterium]